MTYRLITFRDIPENARHFIAINEQGLFYRGVEIGGVRYDADFWRLRSDTPMPDHHKEREA